MKSTGHEEDGVSFAGVKAIRATDKALLCRIVFDNVVREVWVPRSQITDDSDVFELHDEGDLVVTSWWAEHTDFDL